MTIHQHIAAGIDLGSNTFRFLVANCSTGNLTVLTKKMATVGLGRNLANDGLLLQDSMQKGFAVLRTFREALAHYQPQNLRVCGTEALRQAKNSRLFLQKAEELLQQPIDIISGEEEARLSFTGALAGCTKPLSWPRLLVDVGGGSTELFFAESPAGKKRTKSVPLGVVGLTEKFLAPANPDLVSLDRQLTETLHSAFVQLPILQKEQPLLILGCGGTATSMAALDLNLTAYNESLVHSHVLYNTAIEKLWDKLLALPAHKRNTLPCLSEGRGEILPAGIRIYHVLLKFLQQDRMMVSDTGLLEGILLSSLPIKLSEFFPPILAR
jgi:exopolyphosphatase/guanosine-5'-triphosphate,3'-diphosphate pyrophosphatase